MLAFIISAAAAAKSLQSCPTLCDPIDGSPHSVVCPGESTFTSPPYRCCSVAQLCPSLCDPKDCSILGYKLQAQGHGESHLDTLSKTERPDLQHAVSANQLTRGKKCNQIY